MRTRLRPHVRLAAVVCVALLGAATASASAASGGAGQPAPTVEISLLDGKLSASQAAPIGLSGPGDAPLRWDLTGIDRDEVGSDLVTLEVAPPGTGDPVELTTIDPFGRSAVLLSTAPDGPTQAVIQIGRVTDTVWHAAGKAPEALSIEASIPGPDGQAHTAALAIALGDEAPAPTADADPPVVLGGRTTTTSPDRRREPAPTTTAAEAARSAAAEQVVISKGHVDMGPRIVDGQWRIQLKDDSVSPLVWRDLSNVVLQAVDESKIKVPAGADYSFLGATGSDVWLLPQTQRSEIVWPGWNTQDPSITSILTGPVTWKLLAVDGPGSFALFLTDSFGKPQIIFDTDEPLPQQHQIGVNTHVHGNWAFGAAGIYKLRVEMSAPTSQGTKTDVRTLAFAVGSADPQQGFGPAGDGPGTGGGDPRDPLAGASTSEAGSGGTSPSGTAGQSGSTGGSGSLPTTGTDPWAQVGLGLGLVAAGAVALRLRRGPRTLWHARA